MDVGPQWDDLFMGEDHFFYLFRFVFTRFFGSIFHTIVSWLDDSFINISWKMQVHKSKKNALSETNSVFNPFLRRS